jgi:hypothetical protein
MPGVFYIPFDTGKPEKGAGDSCIAPAAAASTSSVGLRRQLPLKGKPGRRGRRPLRGTYCPASQAIAAGGHGEQRSLH